MTPERRLAPLANWNAETDDDGKVKRYTVESEIEEYGVCYEIERDASGKWRSRITADGHTTYRPFRPFDTAEDALAAMMKRCNML